MKLQLLKPRKALNKAFLKVKPSRNEIEGFKSNLIQLIDRINVDESEEFHKNLVADFLKNTYYNPDYFINTKGRNDPDSVYPSSASVPGLVHVHHKAYNIVRNDGYPEGGIDPPNSALDLNDQLWPFFL